MMQARNPKPYGPTYQEIAASVALERGCGISAMACLYFIAGKIDWETGVMPYQLAHKTLGARIGGASYNTVARAMKQLREAGVIDYQSRGNNYDGGDANIYRFKLPPTQNLGGVPDTPTQKLGSPPPKNGADPYPKNGQVNPLPSLSEGEKDAASRGGEGQEGFVTWDQVASVSSNEWAADTRKRLRLDHETPLTFARLSHAMAHTDAVRLWRAIEKKEALRAAMNREGGQNQQQTMTG
jgi:hypothetical protein